MKTLTRFLIFRAVPVSIIHFLLSCAFESGEHFASDVPVRKIELPLPFPDDVQYLPSPDTAILLGTRKLEPDLHEISAYERNSAKKLWQLPFAGNLVGQTALDLVVYCRKDSTVYFIDPAHGNINRKITPQPDPLTSPSSLYLGMAFTNDLYITTKPLYKSVIKKNEKIDTTWQIGLTAKNWETNETRWFLPPVKQMVIIEYPPEINGDKILVINPEKKIGEGHSYQIISTKTGRELSQVHSEGTYYSNGSGHFFERKNEFVRKIDPFTQKEIWRINGSFAFAQVSETGEQLAILSAHPNGTLHTLRIINALTGQQLGQFNLPFFKTTAIKGAFLTRSKALLLHFKKTSFEDPGTLLYDYWVCYDPKLQKALWRTDFHSESISSLIPYINL
jgi:hypothetical protein